MTLSQIDTKDTRTRTQERFLKCYEEAGQILEASRLAKVARPTHYRWLEEDPTYRPRFQTARIKAAQRLEDEAVRRARDGVRKLVLHKGEPVRIEGKLLYEHEYSDRLIEKLLEAGDPDRFNRQRVAPLEGDLDNLTEGQVRALLAWLRVQIQIAKS
jgi:PAS domain-containing protein